MAIHENLSVFKNQPVHDWSADGNFDFENCAIRLRIAYDESPEGTTVSHKLSGLLVTPGVEKLRSLVIGAWQGDDSGNDSEEIVAALVAARGKLPGLRNLFLGDIISEECEISWIIQSDVSPLFAAYPNLEHLTIRGADKLSLGSPNHTHLRELVIQSGGLPRTVIHAITSASFPSLEHLELYLGDDQYGGDSTIDDITALIQQTVKLFPKLKYLGLRDSTFTDEIARVVSTAPVLNQLTELDLSLGTLGDEGAEALLKSPGIRKLKKLNLSYHYMTDEVQAQFVKLGIEVDITQQNEPDEDTRYIAVSE